MMVFGLWTGSLLNSEDAVYADMARTAWTNGDFLDLRWHGAVLHEQPPMLFFLVGGLGGLFGFSDFVVRIPGALFGLLSLYLLWGLARELGYNRRVQRVTVLLLATSFTFVFHSRRVMVDPLFVAAMLGFLWAWIRAVQTEGRSRWAYVAGLCLGASILLHWVLFVLPLLAALGWHMASLRRPSASQVFWAIGMMLLICLPWHLLQTFRYGSDFWQAYAGIQAVEGQGVSNSSLYIRLFGQTDGLFMAAAMPGFAALFLVRGDSLRKMAAPWMMAFLVMTPLQLSGTKMPHYLLSVVPFLALGTAAGWDLLIERKRFAWIGLAVLLALSFLVSVLPDILRPNYSSGTRDACDFAKKRNVPVIVVNTYNVAANWHCGAATPMRTDSEEFAKGQALGVRAVPASAIASMETEDITTLIGQSPGSPIITSESYASALSKQLGRNYDTKEYLEYRLVPGFIDEPRPTIVFYPKGGP
mgnify:CR=1 FL=1